MRTFWLNKQLPIGIHHFSIDANRIFFPQHGIGNAVAFLSIHCTLKYIKHTHTLYTTLKT